MSSANVSISRELLKKIHRDLDACQKVIWLAGYFDPAYCIDAQECLKQIDPILAAQEKQSAADSNGSRFVLPALNNELREILGRPNFMCASIANALRSQDFEIKRKAEDEQATVLHWMLGLYFTHGAAWREQGEQALSKPAQSANPSTASGLTDDPLTDEGTKAAPARYVVESHMDDPKPMCD